MPNIRYTVTGLVEWQERLHLAPKTIRSEMQKAGSLAGKYLVGTIRPLTPVKTGALRFSITDKVTSTGGNVTVSASSVKPYAGFIETGVRSGGIRRKAGPARMFEKGIAASKAHILAIFEVAGQNIAKRLGGHR